MTLNRLFLTTALPVLTLSLSAVNAYGQTMIEADQPDPVATSAQNDDLTITSVATINVPADGVGATLDSDNVLTNEGAITAEDVDNVTGVNLIGGGARSFLNSGQISLTESTVFEDVDNDGTTDGPFAEGTGRTGILISGASPFEGNFDQDVGGSVLVEGNDSFGIQLADGASLLGDINLNGLVTAVGTNVIGVDLAGAVTGDVALSGTITASGENSSAVNIAGDVDGQISNQGTITTTGLRIAQRLPFAQRGLLDAEDTLQSGAAIAVSGNVSNGVLLAQTTETVVDAETGLETVISINRSSVSQFGSAPAVLINGETGAPIAVGVVAEVTNPTDAGFDETLQFAFINQGDVNALGILDDSNATVFEANNVTLDGGFSNTGNLTATTFRSGDDGTADVDGQIGTARVILLGDNVIAETISNQGMIIANVSEAADEVFLDRDNIIPARDVTAIAIEIGETSNVNTLNNDATISALVTGRNGDAIAVLDSSGTLTEINNSGVIQALSANSDALGEEELNVNIVALDLSNNVTGVTINQVVDTNITTSPLIAGGILLGSGDDVINAEGGILLGNVSTGAGADVLALSNGTNLTGTLNDSDGNLALSLAEGSSLIQVTTDPINVSSASIDSTSTFSPIVDGVTGNVSTLVASNTVTIEEGAGIAPTLLNVVNVQNSSFPIVSAGNLVIEGDINSLQSLTSPFLYDTAFALDPNDPNTLVVTLDLRSTEALGLDVPQAAFFSSAFDALGTNNGLASSLINIQDGGEFNSAFNQLLPEFSAASRQFILANVDGAVGAVASHLDSARRSQERSGGVWLEEFAYFADRELAGLAEQYRGFGFGFTGGVDTAWGPFHALGVNVGFSSTEIEDVLGVDDPLNIVTIQGGVYAGLERGNFSVDAYAGGGYNDFESTRQVEIGNFTSTAEGDWGGTHLNGSLRGGYDFDVSERFWVRPTISVDYLRLSENSFEEEGSTGIALAIDDRTVSSASATALLNLGTTFEGRRTWIRPAIRGGYRTEFLDDNVITTGTFAGLNTPFSIEAADFPNNGFILGFSLAAGSEYSSFSLDLDSDIRDGFIRHTGRIVFRLLF